MAVEVNNVQFLTSFVVAALSGGGVVSLIDALRNRGKDKAQTTATLSQATLQFAETLAKATDAAQADADAARQDANAARQTARAAREEADETMRQMHIVRQEMEMMAYRFRRLTGAILDDNVTREDLKDMVRFSRKEGGS